MTADLADLARDVRSRDLGVLPAKENCFGIGMETTVSNVFSVGTGSTGKMGSSIKVPKRPPSSSDPFTTSTCVVCGNGSLSGCSEIAFCEGTGISSNVSGTPFKRAFIASASRRDFNALNVRSD
jgi:hypothetical protein